MSLMTMRLFAYAILLGLGAAGCGVDEVPDGLKKTPRCSGSDCSASVRFDLYHKPLPEIPIPNDAAMWPDPTSRTGLRVNASVVAPTEIEATARKKFDTLEGWGTYAPITVAFDKPANHAADEYESALDLENIRQRHQGDDYDLANDAVYVVNLSTGIPAVMDVGEGAFQYVIREKGKYWRNDTRRSEEVLLWDTADETVDPVTGRPDAKRIGAYDPAWDTDFDGVIDRPNLIELDKCPTQVDVELKKNTEVERDQCIADNVMSFYERETDTLMLRPLVPLEEKTQYAVVITDRMLDAQGKPVRSPFDFVYHPAQEAGIERLKDHLQNPELAAYYGDIGGSGLEHVAFAWTFTTQPVIEDLRVIRDGLYGKGPLAKLAAQFPAQAKAARAAGPVPLEVLAEDPSAEPADWKTDPKCVKPVEKFYVIDFDVVKQTIETLAAQGFGFEGPTLDALVRSFDAIDHVMVGTFESPFFISGGPQGMDPNASFNMDFATGEGELHRDTVQFMLAVPKQTDSHKQPFPVAYYGHGYTSSMLESLGFAGWMASQGIASVGMNATFHGLEMSGIELELARNLFAAACEAPFASAMLQHRARDLDGDGTPDSGGDYWTSYLFHTRDVVRQSVVDLLQMFRIFKSFDGKNLAPDDLDQNGLLDDLAGDFDHDRTPDIGGPNVEYYAWGQSLGGILSPFVAALDPQIVAAAPTSGSGGLLDVGARTFQGGAFEGIYLRNFGPLVVGVPASEFDPTKKQTACLPDQISLRFVVVNVNEDAEVEFNCIDKQPIAASGGTVLVTNGGNGLVRCARMDKEGRFRIGIPSSLGDQLEVQVYDQPDAVDSYDGDRGCNITLGEDHRVALIQSWGSGLVPNGKEEDGRVVCTNPKGCSKFQNNYFGAGDTLIAIAEGFGHIRQTPALRRFMSLASNIIDPGDPVNYAPYYALRAIDDPFGNPHPAKGVLNVVTIGDMNVPLSSGIALGRAAGAVPFLAPAAAETYPALADYVTPDALYEKLGGKTPHRVMIENHVMEGISRLERHPPAGTCGRNMVPFTDADMVCHPSCTPGDNKGCLDNQYCNEQGRCVATDVSPEECRRYLFDVDELDESTALYGEQEASVPLRLARIAKPATPDTIDELWAPRLSGQPFGSDAGAWAANQRVVGQLQAYVNPTGDHGFEPSTPCENWDRGQYMINLIARFFATSGSDVYYLSHPKSHECLAKQYDQGSCPFVFIP